MDRNINVFISYSHKDVEIKNKLEKLLTEKELTVLSDSKNQAGKELHKSISKLLNQSHFVIPIITKNWLDSIETRDEFVRSHERRKNIICLLDSESPLEEKLLPFFIKEDLRIHYNQSNLTEQLKEVYLQIKKANFVDFWKNACYDELRRLGDLIQSNHNLHLYKSEQFEKKLKKLHSELSNIINDNYETNVSYEENFLRDASPYFKHATQIHAVSIINVSTFWTDKKAKNAVVSYLETQSGLSKDVIRLFVFENPRQVHIFKKILLRNYHYYVLAKTNTSNFLSGVLICSKKTYRRIVIEYMNYHPSMGNAFFDQDFGILTYGNDMHKHSLEATLNSINFKIKKINLEDEISRDNFVKYLNEIVKLKDDNYCLEKHAIAKMNGNIFEDNAWNSMVEKLFEGQNTSDIFHVIYFKVKPGTVNEFEELMSEYISMLEKKKNDDELKIKAISFRKFKNVISAKDHNTKGELGINKDYNYALNLVFTDEISLERYYQDRYHSEIREKLYVVLNKATKQHFAKTKAKNISEEEKQRIFKDIESIIKESILRIDWENYDLKNTITPFPLS